MRLWRSILAATITAVLCLAAPSWAAVSNQPVFVQTPQTEGASFTANPGTYKTIYTGGQNGSKITGIFCTSNDTAVIHLVTVQISTSASGHCGTQSTCYGGAAVSIPINAGFANTIPAVNMLDSFSGLPVDSDGNPYIYLSSTSWTLEATYATALTGSTQIACSAIGADF